MHVMTFLPGKKFFYNQHDYLNYKIVGNGPVTVVLLHGFSASLNTWNDILPYFQKEKFRLILIDLKGFGFSSKPIDSNYSIATNAVIISKFLQEKEIGQYFLMGHSFGGGVALLTAIKSLGNTGSRPKALILIDAAAYKTELPFFIKYLTIPVISDVLLAVTSADFQANYTLTKIFYDPEKITQKLINRYAFFIKMKGYSYVLKRTSEQIIPDDFEHYLLRYPEVIIPTLVVWGENDPALPLESGKKLIQDLANAKLRVIKECGHNPQEERPEKTANLILSFIDEVNK